MQMTNDEIIRDFRQARNKKEHIGVLADLNACTVEEIIEILREGGIDGRTLGPAKRGLAKGKRKTKAYTAAELTGTKACDFTAITARVEELLRQRDAIERELSSIGETMSALLLRMKEGESDD